MLKARTISLSFVLRAASSLFCLAGIVGGWLTDNWLLAMAAAVVGLCGMGVSTGPLRARHEPGRSCRPRRRKHRGAETAPPAPGAEAATAEDPGSLVEQMLRQGRYALLLRPQVVENLSDRQRQAALAAFDQAMSRTPAGRVLLHVRGAPPGEAEAQTRSIPVDEFYIDRYAVTNRQYQMFVLAGGYEQSALWDAEILPVLAQFVDRTGRTGPRFWSEGTFAPEQANHPVVGVSWYEAAAYARWVGKRLPSDPEWVKAAAWPVRTSDRLLQRKYPWGDTMDRSLANLWGSGPAATVAVTALPDGASVGGVYQMIGNVWEWMHSDFGLWDHPRDRLETSEPMKSIRGGAFDTYFGHQATCQFQSGDSCVARKHNIGFRCAIAAADLAPALTQRVRSRGGASMSEELP